MRYKLMILMVFVGICTVSGAAVEASIQPSSPGDITLNGSNNYEVYQQFDGTASAGGTTYLWNLIGTSQSDSGPQANFTFDTDLSASNTIRLTVSNGTHSDVDEVTQILHDVPRIDSMTASESEIAVHETVDFSVTASNTFDGPVTYNWEVNGSDEGSGTGFTHNFTEAGDATVQVEVTDQAGNTGTASETVAVNAPDDAGNTSTSNVSRSTGERQAELFSDVGAGDAVSVTPQISGLGVRDVTVTVEEAVGQVKIAVVKKDGQPDDVSVDVAGMPYQYMQINVDDMPVDNVAMAEITFDVSTTWISKNTVNQSTIRLYRYKDNGWTALETEQTAETDDAVTFTAVTPGFSYFAVAGEEAAEQPQTMSTANAELGDTAANTTDTADTDEQEANTTELANQDSAAGKQDGLPLVSIAAVSVLMAVVGGLYWYRERIIPAAHQLAGQYDLLKTAEDAEEDSSDDEEGDEGDKDDGDDEPDAQPASQQSSQDQSESELHFFDD